MLPAMDDGTAWVYAPSSRTGGQKRRLSKLSLLRLVLSESTLVLQLMTFSWTNRRLFIWTALFQTLVKRSQKLQNFVLLFLRFKSRIPFIRKPRNRKCSSLLFLFSHMRPVCTPTFQAVATSASLQALMMDLGKWA